MTFFGLLWILLIIICLMKKNPCWMIGLTILSSTLQCNNVLVIGGAGLGPQIITSIMMIIKTITLNKSLKITIYKKSKGMLFAVILLFLVALFSSVHNNVISKNYLRIIQLLVYIICFFCMFGMGKYLDDKYVYRIMRRITIFLVITGFIQLGITSGAFPRLNIIQILLYNDTLSDVVYFTRNNYTRILSTYMEPSYYAGYIIGAFYYFLSIKEKRQENMWLLVLLFVQIILSFSSTAYGAFCIIGVLFVSFSYEKKVKLYVLIGGLLLAIVMFTFFNNVLDAVVFSKMQSGSGIAREHWNMAALRNFNASPIIGVGYKQSRASSIIYTILSELGIVGMIAYFFLNIQWIYFIVNKNAQKQNGLEFTSICLAILGVVVCQIIAVPDIDICTYWMWMNLLSLSFSYRAYNRSSQSLESHFAHINM